jgi:hypothetical protein
LLCGSSGALATYADTAEDGWALTPLVLVAARPPECGTVLAHKLKDLARRCARCALGSTRLQIRTLALAGRGCGVPP